MADTATEITTFDIDNVEIFKAGKWNGDEYTTKDLDEMVSSFNEIGGKIKPFLKLGHDNKQALLQKDGMPAAGWITGLKRSGDSLLAKFSNIPEKIYELIRNKAYGRMSSEVYWNLKEDGKKYRRVLRAVALLGADTPAVTTLDDFINLYETENYESLKLCNEMAEDTKMDENTIDVQVYTDQINELNSKLAEYEKKMSDVSESHESEKAEFQKKIEDFEQAKIEMYSKDVENFIDASIEKGKILPVQKNILMALASSPSVKTYSFIEDNKEVNIEKDSFELIKEFVEANSPVELGKEYTQHTEIDKSNKSDDDIMFEKVNNYAKEHDMSYRDAWEIVAYEIGGNE